MKNDAQHTHNSQRKDHSNTDLTDRVQPRNILNKRNPATVPFFSYSHCSFTLESQRQNELSQKPLEYLNLLKIGSAFVANSIFLYTLGMGVN